MDPAHYIDTCMTDFWNAVRTVLKENKVRSIFKSLDMKNDMPTLGWDPKVAPTSPEILMYSLAQTQPKMWDEINEDQNRMAALKMCVHSGALLEAWNQGKSLYLFDDDIMDALSQSKMDIADEQIFSRLPQHAQYIHVERLGLELKLYDHGDLTGGISTAPINAKLPNDSREPISIHKIMGIFVGHVFRFDNMPNENGDHTGKYELSMLLCTEDLKIPWDIQIPFNTPLDQCMENEVAQTVSKLLPLVAYLCSKEPDIRRRSAGGSGKKKKKNSKVSPRKPVVYETGFRLGTQLRTTVATASQGGTKRPHIRRAHWHTFWTGPRKRVSERKKFTKWIPPTVIGGSLKEIGATKYRVSEASRPESNREMLKDTLKS